MVEIQPECKNRRDPFYLRLDFYRLLETGVTDLVKTAEALGVELRTLRRWQKAYDPQRGSFGGWDGDHPASGLGDKGEILDAMRREALEGSVPAAKLLLSEYQEQPSEATEEILTVEKAVELLREWCGECKYRPVQAHPNNPAIAGRVRNDNEVVETAAL